MIYFQKIFDNGYLRIRIQPLLPRARVSRGVALLVAQLECGEPFYIRPSRHTALLDDSELYGLAIRLDTSSFGSHPLLKYRLHILAVRAPVGVVQSECRLVLKARDKLATEEVIEESKA